MADRRTTTDAADDDASNDVMDAAEEFDIVGRYARYDEVGLQQSADCDLLASRVNNNRPTI